MSALSLLVLVVHLGAPPVGAPPPTMEVVVARGESLAEVAVRTLGDASAASELRALNRLPSGEVRAGTRLKLPGAARARAQSALNAARAAITQRDAGSSAEAHVRLKGAERLFLSARYDEAAKAADAAWALVSDASAPVHFSVSVDSDAGVTEVASHGGMPVRVEGQGTTRSVSPGQKIRVARGRAPPPTPPEPLPAPHPLTPVRAALLRRPPAQGGGLEPVLVKWVAVPGADGYAVEVTSERGGTWTVDAASAQTALPPLPAGRYRWRVWALKGQERGKPGPTRTFTLEEEPLELDVNGATWQ
ncbi:MAG: peptidoglycan-binding protein LysM [Myxococcaceae bacterium]|nr:peptidoglycan-binding protein LysM [Myxococcaceae bacterium]